MREKGDADAADVTFVLLKRKGTKSSSSYWRTVSNKNAASRLNDEELVKDGGRLKNKTHKHKNTSS